jgi:hypothetical protein
MYERNYATDPRVMAQMAQEPMPEQTRGTILGASTAREVPMAESMNRLTGVISAIADAIMDLDQRTHVMRQPNPAVSPEEARQERSYSPLVGSLNEQIGRLERLHICIRQITSELEI